MIKVDERKLADWCYWNMSVVIETVHCGHYTPQSRTNTKILDLETSSNVNRKARVVCAVCNAVIDSAEIGVSSVTDPSELATADSWLAVIREHAILNHTKEVTSGD